MAVCIKKSVSELKPHPKNAELFDDITGDKWNEFVDSIRENGIIEPLIVTQDNVIVSGHQRVRACNELGISKVDCIVKLYDSEDDVLRDLIETNIRQRGEVGGTISKIGRRYEELKRIYGVKKGRHSSYASEGIRAEDIADELGETVKQLNKYEKLTKAIPELTEAVDSGVVTTSAALAMMKQLSEEEQEKLISQLDATKKYTQREIDEKLKEYTKPEVKIVEKEPDDYQKIKSDLARSENTINGMKKDYNRLRDSLNERTEERNQYRDKIQAMEAADKTEQVKKRRIDTGILFSNRVKRFIEDVSGYIWLTDEIMELPESDRNDFKRSVQNVLDWATQMKFNIEQKERGN